MQAALHRASQVAWLADNYLSASSFSGSGDGLASGRVQAKNLGSISSLVTDYEALASNQTAYQSSTAMWIQAPQSALGSHLQDYVYVKNIVTNGA